MKKFISILAVMLVFVMVFAVVSSADAFYVEPNPNTTVPNATPVVDGNVNPAAEGYSNRVDLSDNTCGHYWAHNPMSSQADLYYAYDDEGLYVAGVVTEGLEAIDPRDGADYTGVNSFQYSTGEDVNDVDDETGRNNYGWNGDIMGIMVDPFGGFLTEGFSGGEDRSAWYMVGLFEGDVVRVYKSQTSTDGEITESVKGAGKKTAAGWDFEVMIPWDMIIADTDDCSMGFVEITKEMLVKEGSYLRVGAMYHDRFFDEEQGDVATWGRYIVVPSILADGSPGPGGIGTNIASYGIELTLGEKVAVTPDPDDNSGNDSGNNGTTDSGNNGNGGTTDSGNKGNTSTSTNKNNTTNKGNSSTSANKGNSTNTEAAQTLDMTVVVALGALATSGLGVVVCKKRK